MSRVGLVVVSHSAKIAEGVLELARQMAPNTPLAAAGGTDDGGIGTSFERITAGLQSAETGAGVVVLCDLGSAILTAETAIDFLDDAERERVRIASAPLVEGSVAAAVAAETGEDLAAVVAAAESAGQGPSRAGEVDAGAPSDGGPGYTRTATLVNHDGLHARPAAEFVKLASTFDAEVTVNGTSAKSLLGIMALGLTKGARIEVAAADDETGRRAVDALADLVATGFGES
ncbi:dihydroxyacetone kinase phosphoryl donor subunit DhaM [Rathayibacter sp. YIM 133350]|uniref:dihydroxyacetone kinase phosphoryl donor subunit DhaM n=1 Tax=Rathayibacter sp. YIM 133350 TaxID=3131992 RepID=UPI00307F8147